MHILRTLVALELIGYYMVRFAPPWETGEPLMAPGCSESLNHLTMTTNSHVSDPCLVSKIKDNYAGSHMCEYRYTETASRLELNYVVFFGSNLFQVATNLRLPGNRSSSRPVSWARM